MKSVFLGLSVFAWLGFMAVMAILTIANCLDSDKLGFYIITIPFVIWVFWFVCKRMLERGQE